MLRRAPASRCRAASRPPGRTPGCWTARRGSPSARRAESPAATSSARRSSRCRYAETRLSYRRDDGLAESSSTRRSTPCVLGCCGPMLTVIVSGPQFRHVCLLICAGARPAPPALASLAPLASDDSFSQGVYLGPHPQRLPALASLASDDCPLSASGRPFGFVAIAVGHWPFAIRRRRRRLLTCDLDDLADGVNDRSVHFLHAGSRGVRHVHMDVGVRADASHSARSAPGCAARAHGPRSRQR